MKTYARYKRTWGVEAQRLGNTHWYEVKEEFAQWFPSGKRMVVVLENGYKLKADEFEIIYVMD